VTLLISRGPKPLAGEVEAEGEALRHVIQLAGLTNLYWLYLSGNQIIDISPLVSNSGIDDQDRVHLRDNPLNCDPSILVHIPALEDRGVTVDWTDTGQCNIADFTIFREDYIDTVDRGVGTDMDGSGVVNISDFSLFRDGYVAGVPGPSGIICVPVPGMHCY
jgi:hypothetical protein